MRNALESGVERTKREKEQSKVTQELVEKKKRKRKRVTYTNEERRENSKVKEYEKLGEIK